MAIYKKDNSVKGSWLDKSKIKNGMKLKIVSETNAEPSRFTDEKTGELKTQDVCKVSVQGMTDSYKFALNRATINGLIDAFGEDSKEWMNQVLTAEIIKRDGKTMMFLVPAGFKRTDDEDGYTVIVKESDLPVVSEEASIQDGDLPF